MLHAKLRNKTCQELDRQGQGQGQGPSLQGPGQGLTSLLPSSIIWYRSDLFGWKDDIQ